MDEQNLGNMIPTGAMRGPDRLSEAEIHDMRVQLDKMLQRVQASGWLKPKEMVEIKIKETRHWLGECLKELGSELPPQYRDSYSGEEKEQG